MSGIKYVINTIKELPLLIFKQQKKFETEN